MALFPALHTEQVTLEPVAFRPGSDIHELLTVEHGDEVPVVSLFTDLCCPNDVGSIALQLEVRLADTSEWVGVITLMEHDTQARHVRAGAWLAPSVRDEAANAARLLAWNLAFANWSVRKVYSWEVHGQWSWTPPGAVAEGTLRQYMHDGSLVVDMDVVATYRSDWDRLGAPEVRLHTHA